eukprot:344807-Hanusia_phi.AAC.4
MELYGAASTIFLNKSTFWSNEGQLFLTCSTPAQGALKWSNVSDNCMDAAYEYHFYIKVQNAASASKGVIPLIAASSETVAFDVQNMIIDNQNYYPTILSSSLNIAFSGLASQDNAIENSDNLLQFSFILNHKLARASMIEIHGLTGSQSGDGSLTIVGDSSNLFVNSQGAWSSSYGTLSASLVQDINANTRVKFGFSLKNEGYRILPRTAFFLARGNVVIPSTPFVGTVLGSGQLIVWNSWEITIGNAVLNAKNNVRVRLMPSVSVTKGSVLMISGIMNRYQASAALFSVSSLDPSVFEGWSLESNVVKLRVNGTLSQYCMTEFNLQFINGNDSSTFGQYSFSSSGNRSVTASQLAFRNNPASWDQASFTTRKISDNVTDALKQNTLTVQLQTNVELPPGAYLTISGLVNSSTPSTSALTLIGASSATFGGKGTWSKEDGTLVIRKSGTSYDNDPIYFSFQLLNPSQYDPGKKVYISLSYTCSSSTCPYPALNIEPQLMLGSVLESVDAPRLLTNSFTESSKVKGLLNIVTLKLASTVAISSGSQLKVSFLKSLQKTDLALLNDGASFLSSTFMNFSTGEFSALLSQALPAKAVLSISWNLRNSETSSTAVSPTIEIVGGTSTFGPSSASGEILSASDDFTISAKIVESTQVSSVENNLYLSFNPNHEIPVDSLITITGLSNAGSSGAVCLLLDTSLFSWESCVGGVLKLKAKLAIANGCSLVIPLKVSNPPKPASRMAIEARVSGTAVAWCGLGNSSNQGVIASNETSQTKCILVSGDSCGGPDSTGQCWFPLKSSDRSVAQVSSNPDGVLLANATNVFLQHECAESNQINGNSNPITFSVVPMNPVSSASITISGLNFLSSQSPSVSNGLSPVTQVLFNPTNGILTFTTSLFSAGNTIKIDMTNPTCPCYVNEDYACTSYELVNVSNSSNVTNASVTRTCQRMVAVSPRTPSISVGNQDYPIAATQFRCSILASGINASWNIKTMEAKSMVGNMDNEVGFTLSSTGDIQSGEIFFINGLYGYETLNLPSGGGVIVIDSWNSTEGLIRLKLLSKLTGNATLSFSLCFYQVLKVPSTPTISSSRLMLVPTNVTVIGNLAEQTVSDVKFLIAEVVQSSQIKGVDNKVTFLLQPSWTLLQQSTIFLSGFGSVLFSRVFQLYDLSSTIFPTSVAISDEGVMRIDLAGPMSHTCMSSFKIKLTNPTSEISPLASLNIFATLSSTGCRCCHGLPRNTSSQQVLNNQAKLFSVSWNTSQSMIFDSSNVITAVNKISLTMVANNDLQPGTMVTLSGLPNFATPSNDCLFLTSAHSQLFNRSCASWSQTEGTLIFTVAANVVLKANYATIVAFELRNGNTYTPLANVYLEASSSLSGSSIPKAKIPVGIVASSPSDQTIPAIEAAWVYYSSATVSDTFNVTVFFQANVDIPAGSMVQLKGLNVLTSNSSFPIFGNFKDYFVNSSGTNVNGLMVAEVVAGRNIPPRMTVLMEVPSYNSADDSSVYISIIRPNETFFSNITSNMQTKNHVPLVLNRACILRTFNLSVSQSSVVLGARNRLLFSISASATILPGTRINISSLLGSTTSGAPTIIGDFSQHFEYATYEPCTGMISAVVSRTISAYLRFSFGFILLNSNIAQKPVNVTVDMGGFPPVIANTTVFGPSQMPQVYIRNITSDSTFRGCSSNLAVKFAANFEVIAGAKIIISGLDSALEKQDSILAVTQAGSTFLQSQASYSWLKAQVTFTVQTDIPQDTLLTFSFPLTNPLGSERVLAPLISVDGNPFVAPSPMIQEVLILMGRLDPYWTLATISRTNMLQGELTTLRISLSPSCPVPSGTMITVDGLKGFQMGAQVQIQQDSYTLEGVWYSCDGRLVFSTRDLIATDSMSVFNFSTRNFFANQSQSAQVYITASKGDLLLPEQAVNTPATFSMSSSPTWIELTVTEQVRAPSQVNLVSFTIKPSVTLPSGSSITIAGLTGTQTDDNDALALVGLNSSLFSNASATWRRVPGLLVLATTAGLPGCKDASCPSITFSVQLVNPQDKQLIPSPLLSATTSVPGLSILPTVMLGTVLRSDQDLKSNILLAASSNVPGASQTLTVTIGPLPADLPAGTVVALRGLSAFTFNRGLGEVVTLSGSEAPTLGYGGAAAKALYSSCGASLTMSLMQKVGPNVGVASLVFALQVSNPNVCTLMDPVVLDIQGWKSTTTTLSAACEAAAWKTASIADSSQVMTGDNKISFTLQPNTIIAGIAITFSGLVGSNTVDNSALAVTSTDAGIPTKGDWKQGTGTLTLTLTSSGLSPDRASTFSVVLSNSAIAAAGVLYVDLRVNLGGFYFTRIKFSKPILAATLRPSFTSMTIVENFPGQRQINTILVSLMANCDVQAGTVVTVGGLLHFLTPSSSNFTAIVNGEETYGGQWNQCSGELAFALKDLWRANFVLTWVVNLVNSDSNHPEVLSQFARASSSSGFLLGQTRFPSAPVGRAASSVVFQSASITESTSVRGAFNSITILLQPSLSLPGATSITIDGLRGSLTPDNPNLPLTGNAAGFFSNVGNFSRDLGRLVITAASQVSKPLVFALTPHPVRRSQTCIPLK